MIKEKKNKCEKAGFEHAWVDTTPNVVYSTFPAQYPDRREKCTNCGLIRFFRESKKTWIEYSDDELSFDSTGATGTTETNVVG